MIGYLKGMVHHLQAQRLTLLVAAVGYELEVPRRLADRMLTQAEAEFWVHQIIREDANELFGFLSLEDREAFRLLLRAPQVGPKLALAILDVFSASELARVGFAGSSDDLLRVKGLGAKLADRLIVDLKSWVSKGLLKIDSLESTQSLASIAQREALQALLHLGYKESQAKKALDSQDSDLPAQALITQALRVLSSRGT